MLASNVLMTAGTPEHMYLDERQEKCLQTEEKEKQETFFKISFLVQTSCYLARFFQKTIIKIFIPQL